MNRKKGFTLIELLIVVAIIGALIAILLPAIVGAFGQVNRTRCQANLSNIIKAMKMYGNNNNQYYPTVYHGRSGEVWGGSQAWTEGTWEMTDHGGDSKEDTAFKDLDGFKCNTSALWLLVRDGNVDPKNLVCPATAMESYSGVDAKLWWSFEKLTNCSYSYQNLLKKPLKEGAADGSLVILADVNPLRADVIEQTQAEKRAEGVQDHEMNSPNHTFEGQNVAYVNGAVSWVQSPNVGIEGNNIWIRSEWKDGELDEANEKTEFYTGKETESIKFSKDSWLVP